ncbi:MAG: hypothetical protein ACOZDY_02615 [Pseudomonadota bacterium]
MQRRAFSVATRIAALALLALGLAWAPVATTAHAVEHFTAQPAPEGAPAPDGPCADCLALAALGYADAAKAAGAPAPAAAPGATPLTVSAPDLALTPAFRERAPPRA